MQKSGISEIYELLVNLKKILVNKHEEKIYEDNVKNEA